MQYTSAPLTADAFFQNVCELDLVFSFYKVGAVADMSDSRCTPSSTRCSSRARLRRRANRSSWTASTTSRNSSRHVLSTYVRCSVVLVHNELCATDSPSPPLWFLGVCLLLRELLSVRGPTDPRRTYPFLFACSIRLEVLVALSSAAAQDLASRVHFVSVKPTAIPWYVFKSARSCYVPKQLDHVNAPTTYITLIQPLFMSRMPIKGYSGDAE